MKKIISLLSKAGNALPKALFEICAVLVTELGDGLSAIPWRRRGWYQKVFLGGVGVAIMAGIFLLLSIDMLDFHQAPPRGAAVSVYHERRWPVMLGTEAWRQVTLTNLETMTVQHEFRGNATEPNLYTFNLFYRAGREDGLRLQTHRVSDVSLVTDVPAGQPMWAKYHEDFSGTKRIRLEIHLHSPSEIAGGGQGITDVLAQVQK